MYSTQAILPELSRRVRRQPVRRRASPSPSSCWPSPVAAWAWGPVSDRIGRTRAIRLASWLVIGPTIGVALAPNFGVLLAFRALQGLCMPGLLIVGAPYVIESFVPAVGQRAMGWYVSALVAGGLIGRVGVALVERRRRLALGDRAARAPAARRRARDARNASARRRRPAGAAVRSAASSTAACSPSPRPAARSSSRSSARSRTSSTGSRIRRSRTAPPSRA